MHCDARPPARTPIARGRFFIVPIDDARDDGLHGRVEVRQPLTGAQWEALEAHGRWIAALRQSRSRRS